MVYLTPRREQAPCLGNYPAPLPPVPLSYRPEVEVGIIYTHERSWMPRLLSTLDASGTNIRTRLILVDNASADGAAQWIRYFPQTRVLHNEQRLPYAANLNRVIAAAEAPYLLLMNTDMFFDPGERCLDKMVDFMRARPDCGVAGCRLYHPDGTYAHPARRFQTPAVILARRLGLGRWMRRTLDTYFYAERPRVGSWECDWLSGCFLFFRRRALEEVGHLDTGFHKYFEDVDICLRMALTGWRPMFNGQTYCFHLEGRGSKRLFSRDAWHHARSYVRWLRKWGWKLPQPATAPVPSRRAA